jgi:signal transduction histidine kinase/ActR/RegA family two-component response regulator
MGSLQRCIRDLAALSALPSLCVGRTPEEALEIVLEALPTALSCQLVFLGLPGTPPKQRGRLDGEPMGEEQLAQIRAVTGAAADGAESQVFLGQRTLWCLEAEIPCGAERGQLVAGRGVPLDPEIDRVLCRTAANVVGSILASADVLEVARRKDDFLAILGHELRNPLAAIAMAVEMIRREPAVTRERDIVERHTRHLSRLVDDLLDISRVTRGHVELRKEYLTLASVLEAAVEIATPLVTRNRHTLTVADASGITVLGDAVRLAQIFGNLLTNAAKFTPPGGRIDVQVERAPGRASVTVRDNGCGLAADQLDRIFEPFVQADRERDALQGGLGLGLAIVSNLAQRHGGSISVRSEGRGRGAAFTVDLPLVAGVGGAAERPRAAPEGSRSSMRVLVVDDNVDVAELLSEMLQEHGFRTAIAHDGHSALAQWRSFVPHVGLLDVGLPDMDGYQLARSLRQQHGSAATLIAASGYGQPQDRSRGAAAGFDHYLVKPVNVGEVIAILDECAVGVGTETAPSDLTDRNT